MNVVCWVQGNRNVCLWQHLLRTGCGVHVFYGSYSHEVDWYEDIHTLHDSASWNHFCLHGLFLSTDYTTLYMLTSTHSLKQQKLPLRYWTELQQFSKILHMICFVYRFICHFQWRNLYISCLHIGFNVVAIYGDNNKVYIVRHFALYYNVVLYKRHALLFWLMKVLWNNNGIINRMWFIAKFGEKIT